MNAMKLIPLTVAALCTVFLANPAVAKDDKPKNLPPGLAKNQARGKPLPPGWQKKLTLGERLDPVVYEQSSVVVPVDDKGMVTIRVEGKLIRIMEKTQEIIELLE